MARAEAFSGKTTLRKFDVLSPAPDGVVGGSEGGSPASAAADGASAVPAAGGGMMSFLSSRFDLPTTSLILSCVAAGKNSGSARMEGFDRHGPAGEPSAQAGVLAAALAAQLVPGWRALTCTPFWRWQLQVRCVGCKYSTDCGARVSRARAQIFDGRHWTAVHGNRL